MNCQNCGKPLPGYEKMYDTLIGLICEDCYHGLLQPAPESFACSLCGREIPAGDLCAFLKDGPCCFECFNMAFTDDVKLGQSPAVPRFLNVTAVAGALFLLVAGFDMGSPLLALAGALGYAAFFLGLSRLVAAAEAVLARQDGRPGQPPEPRRRGNGM